MKKALAIVAIALLCASLAVAIRPINLECPIHDGLKVYFTGQVKFVDGAQLGEYRCPGGHTFWSRC